MAGCSNGSEKWCLFIIAVPSLFFLVVSPWLAYSGPWVTYTMQDTSDQDDDNANDTSTTISEFNLQYPMLQFDRQQRLNKMCINRMSLELFFANPSYYLTTTDACWLAWWAPAAVMLYCGGPISISLVYTIATFALRVSLSVASMIKFNDFNALTDPPFTGYVQGNADLAKDTNMHYDYGFAFGWIVIISNGVGFLVVVIGGFVFCCSSEYRQMMEDRTDDWRSSSRRVRSRLSSRFRKGGGDVDRGPRAVDYVNRDSTI